MWLKKWQAASDSPYVLHVHAPWQAPGLRDQGHRSGRSLAVSLFVMGLVLGCARGEHSDIHATGPTAQARPGRCSVADYRHGGPPAGYTEVARVQVVCYDDGPRAALTCERRLLDSVCQAGGYAMWTLTEQRSRGLRTLRVAAGKPAQNGDPLAVDFPACDPTCSEGFSCDRGKCIAACSPACGDGFRCVEGVCEPQCNPRCEGELVCGAERKCEPPTAGGESTENSAAEGNAAEGDAGEGATEAGETTTAADESAAPSAMAPDETPREGADGAGLSPTPTTPG